MKKNLFTDLSIRKKLPLIVVATCLSALFLAGIAFLANQRRDTRAALVEHISTIAKVIASRSTAAIIFDDQKTAIENLAVLSLLPQIDEAGIFLEDETLFATYLKKGYQANWPQQISHTSSYAFNADILELYEPIELEGKQLGMVYIQTNLTQYTYKLLEQSGLAILITGITLFLVFLLSRESLNSISLPIAELAALTRHVAEKNDYTVRAPALPSRDEIGRLVDDFNNMLVQVEKRDFALQESKNRFRTLLDQAGDAFFLHDSEGRFVEVNERACDSLGYTREELLGMSVFDIDTDALKELHRETVWDTLVPGHPMTLYGTHLRKDGTTFPVEVRIVLVEEGKNRYMQGLARDISARQQAEEEIKRLNERFALAISAARLGVWDWDIPKNELVWDDGMYALYGVKKEDFAGAYEVWLQGLHPEDRSASDEMSRQARLGEREYDTEFRVVWPDGSIHYLKAYGQVVRDAQGNPLRMTGINYDITERKQAEDEVRILNDELEQRVVARTAELEQKNGDLERLNKLFVDRELRMVELKKRIKELEQPIGREESEVVK